MEHSFGSHHLLVDGDVITLRMEGELQPEDFYALTQYLDEYFPAPQRFFVISWADKLTDIPVDTRRLLRQWEGFRRLRGDVTVRSSLLIRAIGTLALRAIQLYLRYEFPYVFVNTEEEARVWIEKIRAQQDSTH
jgi:hypothetical protein